MHEVVELLSSLILLFAPTSLEAAESSLRGRRVVSLGAERHDAPLVIDVPHVGDGYGRNLSAPQDEDGVIGNVGYTRTKAQDGELKWCEGDCDHDRECAAGLTCFQRSGVGGDVPGCTGTINKDWDYCIKEDYWKRPAKTDGVIENVGYTHKKPHNGELQWCEGDCDTDKECAPGLTCFQRNGVVDFVPGCTGSTEKDWDYCVKEDYWDRPAKTDGVIENVGYSANTRARDGELQWCEGDCDLDKECATGLTCFQRNGVGGDVPGCLGSTEKDWDYCVKVDYWKRPVKTDGVIENVGHTPDTDGNKKPHDGELQWCEGDCDHDRECATGLKCFQRNGVVDSVPGCTGTINKDWDYCVKEDYWDRPTKTDGVIENVGYTNTKPHNGELQWCEGDCDADKECAPGLTCFQRNGVGGVVPGCTGSTEKDWDYCVKVDYWKRPVKTDGVIENVGYTQKKARDGELQWCEGDCDSDKECGTGLTCFQRNGVGGVVPGCSGTINKDWDYCVKEEHIVAGFTDTLGQCYGAVCNIWGDPHINTCDGLKYDCQANGIVTLMKNNLYNIQANFIPPGNRRGVTITNDVAIEYVPAAKERVPTMQFSFAPDLGNYDGSSGQYYEHGPGCPVIFYVDGELQDIHSNIEKNQDGYAYGNAGSDHSVRFVGSNEIKILHRLESGAISEAKLSVRGKGPGEFWSCVWNFYVCLPGEEIELVSDSVGLLGTPDGNTRNDWMDTDGQSLPIPVTGRYRAAFEYCHDWCVSEDDSIMEYPEGTSYEKQKCVKEEHVDFILNDDHCELGVEETTEKCSSKPASVLQACLMDCCNGGCDDTVETIEEMSNIVTLSDEEDDIMYDILTPEEITATVLEPDIECGTSDLQKDYRGDIAKSSSGLECQRWDAQSPHSHTRTQEKYPSSGLEENYCRNPDDEPEGAWCYTTDPKKRWEYCNVPKCGSVVDESQTDPKCLDVVLYENDFESPAKPWGAKQCQSTNLDQTPINAMFGERGIFGQEWTVETLKIDHAWNSNTNYQNPQGIGGNYALGMLSTVQDDKAWLDFEAPSDLSYFNLELDLSAIDVKGCGGPFNKNANGPPKLIVTLQDGVTGETISTEMITGETPPNQWTFQWTHHVVSFQKGSQTKLRIHFDGEGNGGSGYQAFDNLRIWSSCEEPVSLVELGEDENEDEPTIVDESQTDPPIMEVQPPKCPEDVNVLKLVGVTEYPSNINTTKIISQDKDTVTVNLNQKWFLPGVGPDQYVDAIYYSWQSDVFNTKCEEVTNVRRGEAYAKNLTIKCYESVPLAKLEICVVDDLENGILQPGDDATIPTCCHQTKEETDKPTVCYVLEINCETACDPIILES